MKKFISAFLTFIICSFSTFSYIEAEDKPDLKVEQEELQKQIQDASGELEKVKDELTVNLQQVQKLDERIATSATELEKLNTQIENLQKSINDVEGKLKTAEKNFNKQKKLLDNRLIAVQESSDIQYLDVILSSKNISDFLSNYFLITELADHDIELLTDMQNKKHEIELSKQKLEQDRENLAEIEMNQIRTSKILENTKIIRENYINKLSDQEKDIQAKIDEYNTRFDEINREILGIAGTNIDTKYIGGELAWPVPGYTRITSKYGMRTHPITGVYKLHTGVDIGAPEGANFIAANDGTVVKASYNSAYGNMVIIDHGGGISTLYAHGSEILVQVGDVVKRGDAILKVGSTGYSTGAHAHFEVRIKGVTTDPMPYITNGLIPETQTDEEVQ